MIEDYKKYTKEDLMKLKDSVVSEYNEYRDLIAQAYEGMKESAERYEAITKEIESR